METLPLDTQDMSEVDRYPAKTDVTSFYAQTILARVPRVLNGIAFPTGLGGSSSWDFVFLTERLFLVVVAVVVVVFSSSRCFQPCDVVNLANPCSPPISRRNFQKTLFFVLRSLPSIPGRSVRPVFSVFECDHIDVPCFSLRWKTLRVTSSLVQK